MITRFLFAIASDTIIMLVQSSIDKKNILSTSSSNEKKKKRKKIKKNEARDQRVCLHCEFVASGTAIARVRHWAISCRRSRQRARANSPRRNKERSVSLRQTSSRSRYRYSDNRAQQSTKQQLFHAPSQLPVLCATTI